MLDHRNFATREAFDTELSKMIDGYEGEWYVLFNCWVNREIRKQVNKETI